MKLLMIQANSPMDTLIPPNLSVISSYLKQHDIQVELFDTTFYKTREITGDDARVMSLQVKPTDFAKFGIAFNKTNMIDDFLLKVQKSKPNLIGLSAVSLTYPHGLKLLKSLGDNRPPTIVGGAHATVCPDSVIKEDAVDMVCVGEGEEALLELCQKIQNNEDITKIRNLWVKSNQIHKNPVRPSIDINTLPFQDWSIFEERRQYKPMGGKIRKTCGLELARGCFANCFYCENNFFHELYPKTWCREKDINLFMDEVRYLRDKYQIEYIYMCCETFLATKKERFLDFIEQYKEFKIPFWMESRPESVTDEKIKLLKEVGCESMNIGIEHGDEEFRSKVLNRKMSNKKIIEAVNIAKKYNIRIGVNNIIGFPDETRDLIFKTIELNREAMADSIMVHPFNPYHGTRLYDVCLEKGYITKETLGGDYRIDYLLDQPNLSRDEVMGLYRTFALYTKFPKDRWEEIELAEYDDDVFACLANEYRKTYLRGSK